MIHARKGVHLACQCASIDSLVLRISQQLPASGHSNLVKSANLAAHIGAFHQDDGGALHVHNRLRIEAGRSSRFFDMPGPGKAKRQELVGQRWAISRIARKRYVIARTGKGSIVRGVLSISVKFLMVFLA